MKRVKYSMYHQNATQSEIGRLAPFLIQEVCPGDTWSGVIGQLMRFSPLKKPLLTDMFVDSFIFYVPHRLVYANWEDFIAEGPMDTPTYTLPNYNVTGINYQSIFLNNNTAATCSALRGYAYNLIWNEFFRDDEQALRSPTGTPGQFGAAVNWKKDYWSELQDVVGYNQEDHFFPTNIGSGNEASARDVLDAIARQKVAMKRATYGTRYIDILRSYGINVNYQMLQRPELVAIARGTVNITDVVSTSDSGTEAVGDLAGHAISGSRLKLKRRTFPEHGTLMGVTVVRPTQADNKVVDWFDRVRDYTSYYDPGLVNLPPVQVTKEDVQPGVDAVNRTDFLGYQPWGDWYRKALSRTHGNFTQDYVYNTYIGSADFDNDEMRRLDPSIFDPLFHDTNNGHWQGSFVNKLSVLRALPRKTAATGA